MPTNFTPRDRYLLRIADTALILSQRNSEWCGHAPVLEEDLAQSNMALDWLGQARALLTHVGAAHGLDEDQLAMHRLEHQFFNAVLAELPHAPDGRQPGDFAFTVARNTALSLWFTLLWERLLASSDAEVAAIAAKALKESRYHLQHSGDWLVRLGDGTAESHNRLQAAIERMGPLLPELFDDDEVDAAAESLGLGPRWRDLQAPWRAQMDALLARATLKAPADMPNAHGGRRGVHSEHLGHLLSELQYLQRAYPGGVW
ncbi:MAG: 1,2-phenylacetyl-CoA epoxidase subunit PaaC [Inhella sp.]|jgi:ring-1,2-phenylacetyl-CoA epoxidase subunit PaaC|uniref:1,2-phenylacetyl-CoA epoxidase subunit PaaC n=1 Tax=Inhella sp. TaxID=1921806 RepID=UPI0022C1786C|nr:1,2-phenylacetyl-CoA epoxidase subunit PaaC [Inhella sp.]MCZ8234950.1 phenylacetate-CoA oxygenase subunit PaaC [Inhella sp.]